MSQRCVAALHVAYQVKCHAILSPPDQSGATRARAATMSIVLILLLTLLNGIFAMSELAVVSSRATRLAIMRDNGVSGAAAALQLLERPTRFLSTVQVGITAVGMLNGIVGAAAFSAPLAGVLANLGLSETVAPILATALVVTAITFITIIFGELVPKRIGQMYPETVARWVAAPMNWLAIVVNPFVMLLTLCTHAMLKLLRIAESQGHPVTEAEISASLAQGVDAGFIEAHEHEMVRNVFHLDDRPLTSLMLPRDNIRWLDAEMSVRQAFSHLAAAGAPYVHSWYPVCRGNLDNVVGLISSAHLLELGADCDDMLQEHVSPAEFIPETLSGLEMLEQLRSKSGRFLLVVDEYGVVQGLMTPRDLLEAITGELQPELTDQPWATPIAANQWLLDGAMPISELKSRLDIARLPLEEKGRYNTLAGLLMSIAGHVPVHGEEIRCGAWTFKIDARNGHRITQVLAYMDSASDVR